MYETEVGLGQRQRLRPATAAPTASVTAATATVRARREMRAQSLMQTQVLTQTQGPRTKIPPKKRVVAADEKRVPAHRPVPVSAAATAAVSGTGTGIGAGMVERDRGAFKEKVVSRVEQSTPITAPTPASPSISVRDVRAYDSDSERRWMDSQRERICAGDTRTVVRMEREGDAECYRASPSFSPSQLVSSSISCIQRDDDDDEMSASMSTWGLGMGMGSGTGTDGAQENPQPHMSAVGGAGAGTVSVSASVSVWDSELLQMSLLEFQDEEEQCREEKRGERDEEETEEEMEERMRGEALSRRLTSVTHEPLPPSHAMSQTSSTTSAPLDVRDTAFPLKLNGWKEKEGETDCDGFPSRCIMGNFNNNNNNNNTTYTASLSTPAAAAPATATAAPLSGRIEDTPVDSLSQQCCEPCEYESSLSSALVAGNTGEKEEEEDGVLFGVNGRGDDSGGSRSKSCSDESGAGEGEIAGATGRQEEVSGMDGMVEMGCSSIWEGSGGGGGAAMGWEGDVGLGALTETSVEWEGANERMWGGEEEEEEERTELRNSGRGGVIESCINNRNQDEAEVEDEDDDSTTSSSTVSLSSTLRIVRALKAAGVDQCLSPLGSIRSIDFSLFTDPTQHSGLGVNTSTSTNMGLIGDDVMVGGRERDVGGGEQIRGGEVVTEGCTASATGGVRGARRSLSPASIALTERRSLHDTESRSGSYSTQSVSVLNTGFLHSRRESVSEMDTGFLHSGRESMSVLNMGFLHSERESLSEMDRDLLHNESERERESVAALDLAFCSISSSSVDVGKSIDSHDNAHTDTYTDSNTHTRTHKEHTRSRGHSHGHSHRMFDSLMTSTTSTAASTHTLTQLPAPSPSSSSLLPTRTHTHTHPVSTESTTVILVPTPISISIISNIEYLPQHTDSSKAEDGRTTDARDTRVLPQIRLDLSDLDISNDISRGTEDDSNGGNIDTYSERHSDSDSDVHCVQSRRQVVEKRDSGAECMEEIETLLTPSPSQTHISTPSPVSPFSPVSLTIPPLSSPECAVSPTLPQPTLASHFSPHLMVHGHGQAHVQTNAQRWSVEVKQAQKIPMTSLPVLSDLQSKGKSRCEDLVHDEGEDEDEEIRTERERETRTVPDCGGKEDADPDSVAVPVPAVRRVRVSKYPRSESLGDANAFAFGLGGAARTRMGSRAATRAGTGKGAVVEVDVGSCDGREEGMGAAERKGVSVTRGRVTLADTITSRGAGTGARMPVDPLFSARPIVSPSTTSRLKGNKVSQIFQQNFSRESRYTSRSPSPSASPSSSSSPQYLSMDSMALDRDLLSSSSASFLRSISVSPPQHRNALLNLKNLDLDSSSIFNLDSSLFSPPISTLSSTFSTATTPRSLSRPGNQQQQQQLSRSVVEFMKNEREIQLEDEEEGEEGGGVERNESEDDEDEGQVWVTTAGEGEGEGEGEERLRISIESLESSSTCSTSILNKVENSRME